MVLPVAADSSVTGAFEAAAAPGASYALLAIPSSSFLLESGPAPVQGGGIPAPATPVFAP
eukprot:3619340-Rhodomonas_salina.1